MTLGPFGQDYTRNITWAEQAKVWNTYLARCSYLLQQGSYVADAAYFYGEGAPATVPFWKAMDPALPTHYATDFINADVLLHHASVRGGRLVLDGGMTYKAVVLPSDTHALSLPVLRKLRELVQGGVVLLSPKPTTSPTLADGPDAGHDVAALAEEIWGSGGTTDGHTAGDGKVYSGRSIEEVLTAAGVQPDVTWGAPENTGADVPYALPKGFSDQDLVYIHRHLPEEEIYFVATQKPHAFDTDVSFRVDGKTPELWHPDTGKVELVPFTSRSGVTTVKLHMDPDGSIFVVFRSKPGAPASAKSEPKEVATVTGPWQVSFPPNWGAPSQATFESLESWTKSNDAGVKYFSGTAIYTKDIDVKPEWLTDGHPMLLDLGIVKDFAEVTVNGKPLDGVLWKPPFLVNVAPAMHAGSNHLEVRVTNLWPNRMIGDVQPGATKTYTFTDFHAFRPDSPLLESGLLGPVRLLQ
jgi:hypothetical protein